MCVVYCPCLCLSSKLLVPHCCAMVRCGKAVVQPAVEGPHSACAHRLGMLSHARLRRHNARGEEGGCVRWCGKVGDDTENQRRAHTHAAKSRSVFTPLTICSALSLSLTHSQICTCSQLLRMLSFPPFNNSLSFPRRRLSQRTPVSPTPQSSRVYPPTHRATFPSTQPLTRSAGTG